MVAAGGRQAGERHGTARHGTFFFLLRSLIYCGFIRGVALLHIVALTFSTFGMVFRSKEVGRQKTLLLSLVAAKCWLVYQRRADERFTSWTQLLCTYGSQSLY